MALPAERFPCHPRLPHGCATIARPCEVCILCEATAIRDVEGASFLQVVESRRVEHRLQRCIKNATSKSALAGEVNARTVSTQEVNSLIRLLTERVFLAPTKNAGISPRIFT